MRKHKIRDRSSLYAWASTRRLFAFDGERTQLDRGLDRLLGRGVVFAAPTGSLRLNQLAFDAQRHQPHPEKGMRCWCLACKDARNHKPKEAPKPVKQPWEILPRKADEMSGEIWESA